MQTNRGVFWGQGMFLSPQHFQQQDWFHQSQLRTVWQSLGPHGWGVQRLDIRDDGLNAGRLEISWLEIVTRDGAVLRSGTGMPDTVRNAALHIHPLDRPSDGALRMIGAYLAIPRHDGPLLGSGPAPQGHRYALTARNVEDAFDGETPTVEMTFLEHQVEIVFDVSPGFQAMTSQMDTIKLADLIPVERSVHLSRTYIPPAVSLGAAPTLLDLIKDMRDIVIGRARDFADLKRERGIRGTAATPQDAMRTLILAVLNRNAVDLTSLAEQPWLHPEIAYSMLRRAVGEFSSFSEEYGVFGEAEDGRAKPLPAYDHENLTVCFQAVTDRLRALIVRLSAGSEVGITLDYDGDLFRAQLPPEFLEGRQNRYYLLIESSLPGPQLSDALSATGKLSSLSEMPHLRRQALFGLPVTYLPVPPEDLPQRSGRYSCFRLDTSSFHWQKVQEEGNIALFSSSLNPSETRIKILKSTVS